MPTEHLVGGAVPAGAGGAGGSTGPVLQRSGDRLLGGVAAGIARHLALPVWVLRLAFVALTAAGGMGPVLYAAFWLVLPRDDGRQLRGDRRAQAGLVLVLAATAVAVLLLEPLGLAPGGTSVPPVLAVAAGVWLVWRQVDAAQGARRREQRVRRRPALLRLGGGGVLLILGLTGFLASLGQLSVARRGVLPTLVVVAALALVSSPWWFAMARDLRLERRERIRSQERAEVAAHLHDSVLQTLALIQRAAAEPAVVARLARSQERELRSWLYRPPAGVGPSLDAALEEAGAAVELAHGVAVQVVLVGDCPVDERVTALVAAAREAMVNAARHAGAPDISVFAEVEPHQLSVFVRDRGCGFDPAQVPADRHGLSGSVRGRMERHGGRAVVRSTPGVGTEVRLELPRD